MYLERILGTSTKISVLNILVNNPDRSYVEKDLAREASAAVSEINRQMPELVNSRLVILERVGKTKLYSINKRHFLVHPLKQLFGDLNKIYKDAADKIAKFAVSSSKTLKAVILIGSVAKGKVKSDLVEAPSDIDLIFVLGDEEEKETLFNNLISYINEKIGFMYGIVCYPIVMSKEEYLKALKKKDEFVIKVHSKGVELYGKKPRRFG